MQPDERQHRHYGRWRVGRKAYQTVPYSQVIVLALKPGPFINAVERSALVIELRRKIVIREFTIQRPPSGHKGKPHEGHCQNRDRAPFDQERPIVGIW